MLKYGVSDLRPMFEADTRWLPKTVTLAESRTTL